MPASVNKAAERKVIREANKERYGYAVIDGERCEVGNYTAEPSSIFMGRGEHPWRGRWKEGPSHVDIELNLSPDALRPEGEAEGDGLGRASHDAQSGRGRSQRLPCCPEWKV